MSTPLMLSSRIGKDGVVMGEWTRERRSFTWTTSVSKERFIKHRNSCCRIRRGTCKGGKPVKMMEWCLLSTTQWMQQLSIRRQGQKPTRTSGQIGDPVWVVHDKTKRKKKIKRMLLVTSVLIIIWKLRRVGWHLCPSKSTFWPDASSWTLFRDILSSFR